MPEQSEPGMPNSGLSPEGTGGDSERVAAVLPNGATVTNVYDAYREGRRYALIEQAEKCEQVARDTQGAEKRLWMTVFAKALREDAAGPRSPPMNDREQKAAPTPPAEPPEDDIAHELRLRGFVVGSFRERVLDLIRAYDAATAPTNERGER